MPKPLFSCKIHKNAIDFSSISRRKKIWNIAPQDLHFILRVLTSNRKKCWKVFDLVLRSQWHLRNKPIDKRQGNHDVGGNDYSKQWLRSQISPPCVFVCFKPLQTEQVALNKVACNHHFSFLLPLYFSRFLLVWQAALKTYFNYHCFFHNALWNKNKKCVSLMCTKVRNVQTWKIDLGKETTMPSCRWFSRQFDYMFNKFGT